MYYKIVLCLILNFSFQSCYKGLEFNEIDSSDRFINLKLKTAKKYALLENLKYKNFSEKGNNYQFLENFQFRADKIEFLSLDSIKVFGNKYQSHKYQVKVKTKIIGTRGIKTVTYTNRTLKLNLDIIQDKNLVLRDSVLNRIKQKSTRSKEKDFNYPWEIRLNSRGVFENCNQYVLWDYFYSEDDIFAFFWVDDIFLKFSVLPFNERFDKSHYENIKRKVENEYLKDFEEQYFYELDKVDYAGLFHFTQGCSNFIKGDEGGIKWKNKECEILFECESNIKPNQILEMFN